jgi:hypothetical protein
MATQDFSQNQGDKADHGEPTIHLLSVFGETGLDTFIYVHFWLNCEVVQPSVLIQCVGLGAHCQFLVEGGLKARKDVRSFCYPVL